MKSYSDLRSEFNAKLTDAQSLDKGKALKSADEFLESFKAPESTDDRDVSRWGDIKADDPIVKAVANAAHRQGFSAERTSAFMADVMAFANEFLPAPVNMEEEWGKLGGEKRGKQLAAAVVADLQAMSGSEDKNALNEQELNAMLTFGNDANRISALSKMMATLRGEGSGIPSGGVTLEGAPTAAEVHAWQGEVLTEGPHKGELRYDHDAAFRDKVDKAFEIVFGTGQTRTSSRLPVGGGNA